MISAELISDPEYNSLSIEAQNIFIRMLAISDDCGVVPANTYRLNTLINTPPKKKDKIQSLVDEIVSVGLGFRLVCRGEDYFAFKPQSFEDYQSYILKKATKSEYLRIPKEEYVELSKSFQEIPRNSFHNSKSAVSTVESRKQKAESNKQKAERAEMPDKLKTPEFIKIWDEFRLSRSKKPLTALAEEKHFKALCNHDIDTAIKMVEQSIRNQWQGIFELTQGKNNGVNTQRPAGSKYAGIGKNT